MLAVEDAGLQPIGIDDGFPGPRYGPAVRTYGRPASGPRSLQTVETSSCERAPASMKRSVSGSVGR
jgi:hypothetical protein